MSELENYVILSSIGEGAFGKVKRKSYSVAKHRLTEQKVAIKFIKKSVAKSLNLETNIIREVRISKKFSHPYIVKM